MNDLISRQDALNDEYHGMIPEDVMKICQNLNWLRDFLSSHPERKTGHWIDDGCDIDGTHYIKCSSCGRDTDGYVYDYCPNCGADMRGE